MLVTCLLFISCDYWLGKGLGTEDTALNGARWTLIRRTSHKCSDDCIECQEKGEWCCDCEADVSCLGVGEVSREGGTEAGN